MRNTWTYALDTLRKGSRGDSRLADRSGVPRPLAQGFQTLHEATSHQNGPVSAGQVIGDARRTLRLFSNETLESLLYVLKYASRWDIEEELKRRGARHD